MRLEERPHCLDISSSETEAQSVPQPREARRRIIAGVGVAFTAKHSVKPLFHENAL